MKGYELSTPRTASGIAAVAMTAITMGGLVVLPAQLESLSADPYTLAAAMGAPKAPNKVAINPARIESARFGKARRSPVNPPQEG